MIQVNDTFYLIGEDKQGGSAFANVNCFSSKDLVQWKYEGALLSKGDGPSDLGANRIMERPKVGVATGDTVCGKYSESTLFLPRATGHIAKGGLLTWLAGS